MRPPRQRRAEGNGPGAGSAPRSRRPSLLPAATPTRSNRQQHNRSEPPHGAMLDPEPLLQPEAVPDREAFPVVVEIREHLDLASPRLEPLRPFLELGLGIVPAPSARARVKADERPVGGHLVRLEWALGMVADHERRAVRTQQLVDVGGEPALVPKLKAVAPRWQLAERIREAVVVAAKVPRQLPEHRPELRRADERLNPVVERPHARTEVAQAPDVRDVAAHLDREDEPGRACAHPVGDHVALRQPVEGRVHLDGVEMAGVVVQPFPRRTARRVEDAVPPMVVVPTGTADSNWLQRSSAANSPWHSSGVPAATTRERPSVSSGAWPNGGASGRSIASPHSRTSSCAAAMSNARASFREQTASMRPAARWQSERAREPMIRRR